MVRSGRDSAMSEKSDSPIVVTTLLDARAIAELFGMDPTWFLKRAREGRLPHVRLGKYVRFDPIEIRAFFQRSPDRHANLEETDPQQHSDSKR